MYIYKNRIKQIFTTICQLYITYSCFFFMQLQTNNLLLSSIITWTYLCVCIFSKLLGYPINNLARIQGRIRGSPPPPPPPRIFKVGIILLSRLTTNFMYNCTTTVYFEYLYISQFRTSHNTLF